MRESKDDSYRWFNMPRWYLWEGGFLLIGRAQGIVPPHSHHAFGGREVVIILEPDSALRQRQASYKLLATTKTSTMQKELQEAGKQGYAFLGLTIGKTAFGGDGVVAIVGKDQSCAQAAGKMVTPCPAYAAHDSVGLH